AIRWASGRVPECRVGIPCSGDYPSRDQRGCDSPPPADQYPSPPQWGEFVGWGTPWGTPGSGPIMTVMPGWNTIGGATGNEFVSRTQYGQPDGFYTRCAWARVLAATPRPPMVVIASYNEYIEENAVAPALWQGEGSCTYCSEQWPTATRYWDLT